MSLEFIGVGSTVSETDVMTLRSNGNVGIGTTSPATTLHLDASGGACVTMYGFLNELSKDMLKFFS